LSLKPPSQSGQRAFPGREIASIALTGAMLILLCAPLVGIGLALSNEANSPPRTHDIFDQRVISLLWHTAMRALAVAVLSTGLAMLVDAWLIRLPWKQASKWVLAFIPGFLLSPYVFTMGWIGLVGTNGDLWRFLGASKPWWNVYSESGVVAMLTISHLPLAVAAVHIIGRWFPSNIHETARQFEFGAWRKFRYVTWYRLRPAIVGSFTWIFVLAFWAYDVPSMLRQNSYALEVFSAFGSFYDYQRAFLLGLPMMILTTVIALTVSAFCRPIDFGGRSASDHQAPAQSSAFIRFRWLGLLLPILGWLIPVIGLVTQVRTLDAFMANVVTAKSDIWNTLLIGLSVAVMTVIFTFLVAFVLRASSSRKSERTISILAMACLTAPGVFAGIGFVYLLNLPMFTWIRAPRCELIIVQSSVVLPLICFTVMLFCRRWTERSVQTLNLLHVGIFRQLKQIASPMFAPALVATMCLAFTLSAREVPASLLNYPSGGSTLAISIETMLHFDQPKLVASLCLLQLALSGAVMLVGGWILPKES
jgi:iron(III) transport system permease protein